MFAELPYPALVGKIVQQSSLMIEHHLDNFRTGSFLSRGAILEERQGTEISAEFVIRSLHFDFNFRLQKYEMTFSGKAIMSSYTPSPGGTPLIQATVAPAEATISDVDDVQTQVTANDADISTIQTEYPQWTEL